MSNHKLIEAVTKSQLRTDLPTFRSGDTLRVHVRIVEGSRERLKICHNEKKLSNFCFTRV